MTANESESPAERLLDLLVYAPAGLALTIIDEFPNLAEKGKHRIEGQRATARMIGQFAVQMGQQEIKKRFGQVFKDGSSRAQPKPEAQRSPRPAPARRPAPQAPVPAPAPAPQPAYANGSASYAREIADPDLAIPAYDTLSASQVVKRLAGLSRDELLEVEEHERSNRHRATILNRVEQLLSGEDPDPAPSEPGI
jgi:hypothetical protein